MPDFLRNYPAAGLPYRSCGTNKSFFETMHIGALKKPHLLNESRFFTRTCGVSKRKDEGVFMIFSGFLSCVVCWIFFDDYYYFFFAVVKYVE